MMTDSGAFSKIKHHGMKSEHSDSLEVNIFYPTQRITKSGQLIKEP